MENNANIFDNIVRERRSVRTFDSNYAYNPEIVKRSLERAILSPNSSNMQLWEFYRLLTDDVRQTAAEYCMGQMPAKTANELVVFVARPDLYKRSIKLNLELINNPDSFERESSRQKRRNYFTRMMPLFYMNDFLLLVSVIKKLWVSVTGIIKPSIREVSAVDKKVTIHKSIALAAQTFMLSVKSEGYDTCPMEGFDSKRLKRLLKLPRRAQINMVIAVGKAAPDGIWYPQVRFGYNTVVKEL